MRFNFLRSGDSISPSFLSGIFIEYHGNILDQYQFVYDVSPSMKNENHRSCEQKLIKPNIKELESDLESLLGEQLPEYRLLRNRHIHFIKQIEKKNALLHLIHEYCIPGQEEKMKVFQVELNETLHTMTEEKRYYIFEGFLSQRLNVKSNLTEIDFLTAQLDPKYEFQLKVCFWDIFCAKINKKGCKKNLQQHADYLVSNTETKFSGKEKTKLIFCKILLCLLDWNKPEAQTQQIMETPVSLLVALVADTSTNYSFTAYTVSHILIKLLTHSEDDIITTFNNYLEQKDAIKFDITNTIEPYDEFMLKLCYYMKEWSKYEVNITRNAEFFLSMVEEVNKRNHFMTKFKMCQVLNIIMNGKIHITESMIQSVNKMCEKNAGECLMAELPLSETNLCKYFEKVYHMVASILLLKSRLDNFREFTKILIQYQHHIKELLLSLLADMLIQLSTQQINEILYLHLRKPYVSNLNIHLELAKTFLDICISPKISHHKKSIIEDKIQPIISSHEYSKTALSVTTELTDSTKKLLDHKGIINICIKVVKTESKFDINIPMYEGSFCTERKAIANEVEMMKRSQETETLVLLMLLLITITSTGHHKSAKLKKYLTLKYEYHMASLYLLWCSGDIEVHPGPSLNKKTLAHDSTIERRWILNISPKIIIRLLEHEQSTYKPTKKLRNDSENREHFKSLLKTCQEEQVHVPKMYLAEINAWESKEYQLLHKLFVYRCEIETIITSLQDFFICGSSTNDLTDINISFHTELLTNEIAIVLGKDQRPKDKSQLMAYITGKIANILIKCAHGEDPDAKHDGLWDLFLKNWPTDIILFDPNNREKYSKKYPRQKLIPDQELVDILLTLPQVTIPQKYKAILDAFRTMRKSQKDKSTNKQHKAELCRIFKRIYSLEKLDYALKKLWESGIFTEEVHNNLNKWWTTGAVDTTDDQSFSQVDIKVSEKKGQPHILMNISTKYMTLTVEQTDAHSSQVSYEFPFSDELVPLKTKTTIQKPSIDSYQKVTAKKYFTVSPKQDACPTDNQTTSIIIPPEALKVLNTIFPCHLYPNSHPILENDIKHQHEMSFQETAVCSIHLDQPTFSTNQFTQWNQNIAISVQPGPILCTPNQSKTNSDDISSATKDTKNPDFHTQVSLTSDMGSSDLISSVNSGNEERDQHNTSNGGQDQLTDSDYSSDSSNNCVSNTSLKKRKCIEEDRIEMKKRKIPSLKKDKKQSETTSHRKIDSSMDNSTTSNKDMELLLDYLDIDLESFDIDDQTFEVEMNALDNEDKNLEICDKDGNLMNDETQISNKNTTVSAYDTNVSSDLEMFLQEMIYGESEKMIQMKSYLPDV